MWWRLLCIAVAVSALPACALRPLPGAVATAEEPLHAESGVGVTIWKFPIVGIGGWGFGAGRVPEVVVYNYNYQAVPSPATPSGIPVQPPGPPQPVPYGTIYPAAPSDDPTRVIFVSGSDRATLRLRVQGQPEIVLPPRGASADIQLGPGEHKVEWFSDVPTAHPSHPTLQTRKKIMIIRVEAEERARIITLPE